MTETSTQTDRPDRRSEPERQDPQTQPGPPGKTGLVLSGGGSRGAFETGVLLYLREALAKRLGFQIPFDIVTGTSVGAINGAFIAATNDDPVTQGARLAATWRSLRLEELISLGPGEMLNSVRKLFGRDAAPPDPHSHRHGGILDTSGLERFVVQAIPWRGIHRNIRQRRLSALSVSATHVGTGHTHVFLDSADPVPAAWSRNPFVRHRAARIGPRHVLASAAIPMLFPAVKIGREFYTDGGLRQNTPMSPAIRMGASKLLMISLRHLTTPAEEVALTAQRESAYPRPLFLAGKALNALLLDHTEYDLDRMERINAILRAGTDAFGPEFVSVLNRELMRVRGAPLRRLEAVHIRPSVDIGMIASEFVVNNKVDIRGRLARRLVKRLAERESSHENDLISYLLFDGNFASALIDLGYHDAKEKEDELIALFSDLGPRAATRG